MPEAEAQPPVLEDPVPVVEEQPPVADERVAAVRRVSASTRRWRAAQLGLCAASLALALTAGAVIVGALRDGSGTAVAATTGAVSPELLAGGDLDASITSLQAHLRTQPKDFDSWATLGLAYVEQARTKGDPLRYPQAQQALDRSLKLRPRPVGARRPRRPRRGAARLHRRPDLRGQGAEGEPVQRACPLLPYRRARRTGRYADASKAADLADSRRPGVPVFTRYAYVHELRGDVNTARRVLQQALDTATSRGTSPTWRRRSANSRGTRATTTPR